MDSMFEQLWDKFTSLKISVNDAIEINNNRVKKRDVENLSAFIISGNKENAQELLIELFHSTPKWNPLAVTTLLQKAAEFFYSFGQYEDAAIFAERGLQWDPANPELIALICKSNSSLNPERSLHYLGFIKDTAFNESLLAGYVTPESAQSIKSYKPEINKLSKMTDDHLFNLMVFQAAALHRRPLFESIDALRSHALACIAGGHLHVALVAVRLALFRLKDPLYISGLNPIVIQIKSKWSRVIESLILNAIDSDSKVKSLLGNTTISERLYDRQNAIEELNCAHNLKGLFCFVMDPVPEISFLACQYLLESGEEKLIANYLISASQVAIDNKEIYGDLKPHQLLRLMKTTVNITPKENASKKNVISENLQQENTISILTSEDQTEETPAAVKKIVRRKLVTKEIETVESAPVKKKCVAKKSSRKKV